MQSELRTLTDVLISPHITLVVNVPNRINARDEIILCLIGLTGVCLKRGGQ